MVAVHCKCQVISEVVSIEMVAGVVSHGTMSRVDSLLSVDTNVRKDVGRRSFTWRRNNVSIQTVLRTSVDAMSVMMLAGEV